MVAGRKREMSPHYNESRVTLKTSERYEEFLLELECEVYRRAKESVEIEEGTET